jgi:hypothetical protein
MPLLVLAVTAVLVSSGAYAQEASESYKLSPLAVQKWSTFLPSETWSKATGELAIPHAGGTGFACAIDGQKLMVDTNGDGRVDMPVKGVAGFLKLVGESTGGSKFMYPVRFRKAGEAWEWAASGMMKGRVKGGMLSIIDQNNNGKFNDYGVDAMMVGSDRTAGYLSKVVNLKGDLYNLEVSEDGSEVKVSPFTGETGLVDLRSGFKSYGRLEAAIVVNAQDSQIAFNLADSKGGVRVPAGKYILKSGLASKGAESALIKTGESTPIAVGGEDVARLEWGAPVVADVSWTQTGNQVSIQPTNVHYYGRAGEEYHAWNPDAKSPKLLIKNAESGKLIKEARFGGC